MYCSVDDFQSHAKREDWVLQQSDLVEKLGRFGQINFAAVEEIRVWKRI